jgi:hypothetical protein
VVEEDLRPVVEEDRGPVSDGALLAVGVLILGSLCVAGIDRDTLAPTCMHYQGEDPTVPPGICQARVVDWCGLNHPEDPIAQCTDKVYGFAPSNY